MMAVVALGVLASGFMVPVVRREIGARLGKHTVEERLRALDGRVRPRWNARVTGGVQSVSRVTLVVLKHERELRVYTASGDGPSTLTATYPVLAASGTTGPKIREGDGQVPEGTYRVSFLNPNSRFHLSLRVDYPNAADFDAARCDGRGARTLGGDIMIHGGAKSIGCVAIGDPAIEEVFWLVGTVGIERTEVILSPGAVPAKHMKPDAPAWLRDRYARISEQIRALGIGVSGGG